VLANAGKITMFGKSRGKMTRLLAVAEKGNTVITVAGSLDYAEGDKILIMGTSYSSTTDE